MQKALVIYYSRSGNTEKMARLIAEGIEKGAISCTVKAVAEVKPPELKEYAAIVIGSPVYYGSMAAQIKRLLDDTVAFHGGLEGKVGGAFSSSANIAGGNETTITDILNALLIHGMIIQGDPRGDHYGPVSIGEPDTRAQGECRRFGERIARLVVKCTS